MARPDALAARPQRRDDLAVGRERLRRQLPDLQHVLWQRANIVHCRLLKGYSMSLGNRGYPEIGDDAAPGRRHRHRRLYADEWVRLAPVPRHPGHRDAGERRDVIDEILR